MTNESIRELSVEEKLAHYNKLLKENLYNSSIYFNIANCHFLLNDYENAVKFYGGALLLDPNLIGAHLNTGNSLMALHRYDEAVVCYHKVIYIDPTRLDSYYNLGKIEQIRSNHSKAIENFHSVIKIRKDHLEAYNNIGISYQCLKNYEKAIEYYKLALELNSNYAEIYSNLADALNELKQYDEAIMNSRKALEIKPDLFPAYNNLGVSYIGLNRNREAIENFKKSIELDKKYSEAHKNLGMVYQNLDEIEKAIMCYQEVSDLDPCFEIYYIIGDLFSKIDKHEDALKQYQLALQYNQNSSETYKNIGFSLIQLKRYKESITELQKAIEINPHNIEACNNLGHAYLMTNEYEKAINEFSKVISLQSNDAKAYYNKGVALVYLNRFKEAIEIYQKSIEKDPQLIPSHFNLALVYLLTGEFEKGWKKYEYRWLVQNATKRDNSKLFWNGENITGKIIYIKDEQGFGDIFQFIRYIQQLSDLGAKILIEIPRPLVRLIEYQKLPITIIPAGEKPSKFDIQSTLLSLPGIFKTNLTNIPLRKPYLKSPDDALYFWKKQLNSENLKVGIVWAGSSTHFLDHKRSIDVKNFEPLFDISNIEWFSLQNRQKSTREGTWSIQANDISRIIPKEFPVKDLSVHLTDFAETAAIIESLDLIITVDTAVAHLAGALGKKCWVMLPYSPDWRWLLNRDDSPWYTNMKLFRQNKPDDWNSVIQKIKKELIS